MITDGDIWDEWFNAQYSLIQLIDRAVDHLSEGKNDAFRASVYSAVLEHVAEKVRLYITPAELAREAVHEQPIMYFQRHPGAGTNQGGKA